MTQSKYANWIWLALLATMVVAVWPVQQEEDALPDATMKRGQRVRANPAETAPDVEMGAIRPLAAAPAGNIVDLFPRQSWQPPPPAPVDEKPVAPPLPFSFGGRYEEGGRITIFLKEGEQVHSVAVGDIVKGSYRVEKLDNAAVTLTYLPLSVQQTLPIEGVTR